MKRCRVCRTEKSESEFYKDRRSKDGLTSDCKECRRARSNEREKFLRENDSDFAENERKRARMKYRRLYVGKVRNPKTSAKSSKAYAGKYPEKKLAHSAINRLKKKVPDLVPEGFEFHHFSYKPEDHYRGFILMKREHRQIHLFMRYWPEEFSYMDKSRTKDLRDPEAHGEFIAEIIGRKPRFIDIPTEQVG